nr:hypothetical protein [Tanacetum cinerariifolium]
MKELILYQGFPMYPYTCLIVRKSLRVTMKKKMKMMKAILLIKVMTEHEEEDVNKRVHTPSDYELTDDEKIHDEENIDEEEEHEVSKELYDDVNVNLGNEDTEMTDADQAGSESRPPMLNKENYVPWSSRLLRYAKSRPNGKLIHNSILNEPYVRRMIPEPCDANREVTVTKTFHVQTDDELSDKELKQIEADDQAIQTILLGLPEDTMLLLIAEKNAKLFNEWERFTSNERESVESYYHRFLKLMNDLKRNKHFPEKIASNLKFLNNLQPEWSRHVTIVHQTKDLHTAGYTQLYDFLKYNQKEIAQPGMNMGQDRQMHMVGGNGGNQFRQYAGPNARNMTGIMMLLGIRNGNQNQIENGNLVAARAEGNVAGQNGNQIRYGSAEVHENCDDNEIFNMFTREEQYTELLEPIPESHQVPQNDNDVISEDTSVEQGGETVEQHPANFKKTRALYESLCHNLAIEVEKVNSVNRKLKETNADLTTELARFKNQTSLQGYETKVRTLQAQLVDLKGKCKDTSCVSDTRNPLSKKLESKNAKLEFQVLNYARENAYLKATYKNLFDSIYVLRTQTKTIIASLQNELQSTIYKNDKLRTQLFKKVSYQKDNTQDTSENTKFPKQPIVENLPKVGETHALSKPVTSNSVSTPQESKCVNNDKLVQALGQKSIIVSQPPVFTKKDVNSDSNGLSSIGVDNTAKTQRTQPRSSSKNNKVPYVVKSSYKKNKEADVEENHRNLLSSSNKKHVSSKCNNVKLATQNVYSKVVCAMCKQCLISVNHDVCLRNYVNGINSRGSKQNASISNVSNQKKHKA